MPDNLTRLLALLPGSGIPADLQAWLLDTLSLKHDQQTRDRLIRKVLTGCKAQSDRARAAYLNDLLSSNSPASPEIEQLRAWPTRVPVSKNSIRQIMQNGDVVQRWLCGG